MLHNESSQRWICESEKKMAPTDHSLIASFTSNWLLANPCPSRQPHASPPSLFHINVHQCTSVHISAHQHTWLLHVSFWWLSCTLHRKSNWESYFAFLSWRFKDTSCYDIQEAEQARHLNLLMLLWYRVLVYWCKIRDKHYDFQDFLLVYFCHLRHGNSAK